MNKEGKKEKKGFVSIVIPVYNVQKKIVKCLQSICNQSYQNFEILCIDDGSTDSTIEIIKKLAQKDCRIQLIQKAQEIMGFQKPKENIFYSLTVMM